MRRSLAALAGAALLAAPPAASAQDDSLRGQAGGQAGAAMDLVHQMGYRPVSTRVINRTIERFRGANPEVPRVFWGEISQELVGQSPLLRAVAEVYAQHFSVREIEDLRAFYATPTGRKLAGLLVTLADQNTEAAGRASQEVERRIRAALEAAGYIE